MTKRQAIVRSEEGETLHVMGSEVKLLCRGEHTEHAWSVIEVVLPIDTGPPPHDHAWDECYYIVDGQVSFSLGGQSQTLRAGDFVFAPGGVLHGFRGASATPARMLIFDAPAHAEGFFRDAEREVKAIPGDLGKVPEIGNRHGIRFAKISP